MAPQSSINIGKRGNNVRHTERVLCKVASFDWIDQGRSILKKGCVAATLSTDHIDQAFHLTVLLRIMLNNVVNINFVFQYKPDTIKGITAF